MEDAANLEKETEGTIVIGQGEGAYEVKVGLPTEADRLILTKLIGSFDRLHRYDPLVVEKIITLATPYWNDEQDIDTTIKQIDCCLKEYFSSI